ncbi:hypothetical protein CTRI78_v003636 [Colletotrichum trifolii]|uniref:Uncharacterized protein n=1 Tax=Colletotrichum trifolii TaxID=5466 RepID=A0A4R8RMK6_COLTR|nr:hypothetical protein CTRI78_v003636 [Colletotrichum trifolii]
MVGTARSSVTTILRPKLPLRATTNARKTLQEDPELPVCRGGRRADDQKSHLAFPSSDPILWVASGMGDTPVHAPSEASWRHRRASP